MSTQVVTQALKAHFETKGPLSLADYMDICLYHPKGGYYQVREPIGRSGDFTTAPVISPLFAYPIAKQCAAVLQACQKPDAMILELGPGSGHLAEGVLKHLDAMGQLPDTYGLLDVSASLRLAQKTYLKEELSPHIFKRLAWFEACPKTFSGVVLANEVLDALPVHQIQMTEAGIEERRIVFSQDQLAWQNASIDNPSLKVACDRLAPWLTQCPKGTITEVNLAALSLLETLYQHMAQGAMLFLDYGYPACEYYHPTRQCGTLMAYEDHKAWDNVLERPGLRDITAHVDFTLFAHKALSLGLKPGGFTTMANFLVSAGILEAISQTQQAGDWQAIQPVKTLLLPGGMGEMFKVIGLEKGLSPHWVGFERFDHWARLGIEEVG